MRVPAALPAAFARREISDEPPSLAATVPTYSIVEPVDGPLLPMLGTERTIESDRRFVPVEHSPLESTATSREGRCGNVRKQALAESATAAVGLDEEVFQVKARTSEKRGER